MFLKMIHLLWFSITLTCVRCTGKFQLFDYESEGWELASINDVKVFKTQVMNIVRNYREVLLSDGCLYRDGQTIRSSKCCRTGCKMLFMKDIWTLQKRDVCFETKSSSFGKFEFHKSGNLIALKLRYISGSVSCGYETGASHWGCVGDDIGIAVTDENDDLIYPQKLPDNGRYKLEHYYGNSSVIIFHDAGRLVQVTASKSMRLWFSSDLKNHKEDYNKGRSCVNIYALIIDECEDDPSMDGKCTNFINEKKSRCQGDLEKRCGKTCNICSKKDKVKNGNLMIYIIIGVIGGLIIICIIVIVVVLQKCCPKKKTRSSRREDKEMKHLYCNVDDVALYESPDGKDANSPQEGLIYSELGEGGRVGERPIEMESNYAQVKTEGANYPTLDKRHKDEELYSTVGQR